MGGNFFGKIAVSFSSLIYRVAYSCMVEGVLREVRVWWNCGGGGKNWVVELWVLLIRLAILIGETDSSLNSSGMTAYELKKKLVAGN